jgi:uncharacterized protein
VYQLVLLYRRLRQDPRVGWLDEPEGLEIKWFALASLRTPSPKRWMDAYLCAFARSVGADLVTFDRAYLPFEDTALKIVLLPLGYAQGGPPQNPVSDRSFRLLPV